MPEQASGRVREIGPGTDIYALGAILYDLLTGRPPFKANTLADTLHQVQMAEPVSPTRLQPQVPRDLAVICLKCLTKEPGRRYQTALALAEDLGRFQTGEPIQARPAGMIERAVKWSKRRPTAAALIAVSVLSFLAMGIGGWWFASLLLCQSKNGKGPPVGRAQPGKGGEQTGHGPQSGRRHALQGGVGRSGGNPANGKNAHRSSATGGAPLQGDTA